MRIFKLLIILALSFPTFQCKNTTTRDDNKLSIEITHFAGAAGLTIYYIIADTILQVDTNCDFQDCTRKTIYKRTLTIGQLDTLIKQLQTLHLDTLKKSYSPEGMVLDGLMSTIKIKIPSIQNKNISINNVDLPATDSLYMIIDNLILTRRYQFNHFGQE